MRNAVVCLINSRRRAHHLPALNADSRLNRAAQGWTDTMVRTGTFAHVVGKSDPGSRVSRTGYTWSALAENIATGYPTPRKVVAGWMASPGHCRNILSPVYREVGTGVNRHPVGGTGSGPATWTQDFGLAAGAQPPSHNGGAANSCPR
jgi:uncharacterized protein YkwD